jgi:hypothetical protein
MIMGWLKAGLSALRPEPLLIVLKQHDRGIYKRIDENRELLELLQREVPWLLHEKWWIEGWLHSQDRFLTALEEAARGRGGIKNPYPPHLYPRKWPGKFFPGSTTDV